MSFQNQSGDLAAFTEVVPASAAFGAPERSSILTGRRRARVVPQTGPTAGPNQQVQFLIADQGGMIDLKSVVISYNVTTSGAGAPVLDDGHIFSGFQVLLNGQILENQQNSIKVCNAEMTLAGSKGYYQTAGSLQGFELLNGDLAGPAVTGTLTAAMITDYGNVFNNLSDIRARTTRAAAPVFNSRTGEQRSIPLGLCCGLGRMNTYLPISLVGELALVLTCASQADVLMATTTTAGNEYLLDNLSIEYDIVVPDQRYHNLLKKIATEDGNGLVMPYESTIVSSSTRIAPSATLTENTIIVSRATNNLLRAAVVFIQNVPQLNFPSQSMFSHAGVVSVQFRVGSQVYPQIACNGDAALFNMSLAAYGSVMQENGSCTNRVLYSQSTDATAINTPAVFETEDNSAGGSTKFCYGDRFVAAYGFQVVKGGAEPMAVDGISLSGSSGSQLICSVVQAPGGLAAQGYTPFVITTALRFIVAKGGAVSVTGS